MKVVLKSTKGASHTVDVQPGDTVGSLIAAAASQHGGLRVKTVVWDAKVLRASQTLVSAGINRDGATCIVVLLPAPVQVVAAADEGRAPAQPQPPAADQALPFDGPLSSKGTRLGAAVSSEMARTRSAQLAAREDEARTRELDLELEQCLSQSARLRQEEARSRTLVGVEETAQGQGQGQGQQAGPGGSSG
eukprot:SAG22_NODE_5279_length_1047_cov_1.780591_2_plen_190_part_01